MALSLHSLTLHPKLFCILNGISVTFCDFLIIRWRLGNGGIIEIPLYSTSRKFQKAFVFLLATLCLQKDFGDTFPFF